MLDQKLRGTLLIYLMLGILGFSQSARGIDLKPDEIRGKAAQSPVTILQNRYFTKAWRPELGLAFGTITNEAYTDTSLLGFRAALFFNEWVGAETQALKASVKDSDDAEALKAVRYRRLDNPDVIVSANPEVNRIKAINDVNCILAPFYGKLNFADWLIVYSDLYLTAGLARLDTDQGGLSGISYGAGQRFYWQKALSFRVDFRGRMYTEKRLNKDFRKSTYSVDLGVSLFLF